MNLGVRPAVGSAPAGRDPDGSQDERERPRPLRLALGIALLVGLYLVVAGLGDPRMYSGSDAGGKAATVKVMAEGGGFDPDVGYWAASLDPDGRFHPLVFTSSVDGRYLQVTSLPMIIASVPLWRAGGPRLLLLWSMAAGVATAVAARSLARSLGAGAGWFAFWLVGATTPVVFYATDFWEHVPGVACGLGALALVNRRRTGFGIWTAAGLLAGTAVVLRSEMVVYLIGYAIAGLAVGPVRRSWRHHWPLVASAGAAAAVAPLANAVLERAVLGGDLRAGRVAGQVVGTGSDPLSRLQDASLTSFGLFPDRAAGALALSAITVVGLVWLGLSVRGATPWWPGVVLTVPMYLLRLFGGLGFVPGSFVAAPVSGAAVADLDDPRARALVFGVLIPLPVIWLTQWHGNLVPQWGGRYLLLTAVVLTTVGSVVLERVGWAPVTVVFVGLAVVMPVMAIGWHAERTRDIGAAVDRIQDVPESTVLVTPIEHLPREAGATYGYRRWLRAGPGEAAAAMAVARDSGAPRIDLVDVAPDDPAATAPTFAGLRATATREVPFVLGTQLLVTTYVAV